MALSFMAGILISGNFNLKVIIAFFAISLYINSKQAFTHWMRSTASDSLISLTIFLVQVLSATLMLLPLLKGNIIKLLPYASVPLAYIILLRLMGEHALLTEISGFILLSMSALIARFAASGEIDPGLFIVVAVFFTAGVFKVRVQFKKKIFERVLMISYLGFALSIYHFIKAPIALLLPLMDNLLFSLTLYKVKLATTGWIEVIKGVLFLFLLTLYYRQ